MPYAGEMPRSVAKSKWLPASSFHPRCPDREVVTKFPGAEIGSPLPVDPPVILARMTSDRLLNGIP